ncbi:DNA-binding protein [Caballeronia sp. BR00000012568055]|uniref:helix-turn-helix domain-containing transcriptional regulator n=1 Tax=Caballeronia sp. BR00000012568055 TaxID=2918761 RepID=UPI0023F780F8|nr:transcriptional regulator [Caballeronia sp. BR00000012568055]
MRTKADIKPYALPDAELIARLGTDRAFASEYVCEAMRRLNDPDDFGAALTALRDVANAAGGVGAIARAGGGSRPSIYRALSPGGNPTLKTLIALLNTIGLRLAIEVNEGAAPDVPPMSRGPYARSRKRA